MAKQTGLFRFTGKLDNVIGYRRNGAHFVRSMPEKVRQTAATRRAAKQFGVASNKGRLIRRAFAPHLNIHDGSRVNRLTSALLQGGPDGLQSLHGFRFNRHTGIEKLFPLPPVYTAEGKLHIPARELSQPGKGTHLEVRVIAARINFAERRITNIAAVTAIIHLDKPFNDMQLNLPAPGKGTLLVVLQVRACIMYNGKLLPSADRRYMAADIIAVVPPVALIQPLIPKGAARDGKHRQRPKAGNTRATSHYPGDPFCPSERKGRHPGLIPQLE